MKRPPLVERFITELEKWKVPAVNSEAELDNAVRDFIRSLLGSQIPENERKQWVAGHKEAKPNDRFWSESKPHQNVLLWGASKTSDLFVFHRDGKYGLPPRGISFEIKYVKAGESYAGPIATVAGQLLAYSVRHEWTIGFVFCERRRAPKTSLTDGKSGHADDLKRALPANATLLVRFRHDEAA